jgi:hypothetical protein
MSDFSEIIALTLAELYKGLDRCRSSEAEEAVSNMVFIFLYNIMRTYDKNSKFDISSALSPALCDAAIKLGLARLLGTAEDGKLSFTTPQRLRAAAETELALIINDWK